MQCELYEEGPWLSLEMAADGFLYNMVRITMGTLLEIGRARLAADSVPSILQACCRSAAGPTAPPQGLYLVKVDYPAEMDFGQDDDKALPEQDLSARPGNLIQSQVS
jgi:tRNA pseudouridine38-40 synthase